jgi:hypothetical protein
MIRPLQNKRDFIQTHKTYITTTNNKNQENQSPSPSNRLPAKEMYYYTAVTTCKIPLKNLHKYHIGKTIARIEPETNTPLRNRELKHN